MKKTILFVAAFSALFIVAFIPVKRNIVGTWLITYKNGNTVKLDIRTDGTIKADIPAEHFTVIGNYKMKGDVFSVTDSTCGVNYWGKYKLRFFGDDSVYSEAIEDSCLGRKSTVDKMTLIRIK
ncbi:MAG TPA: hypothetical protein VK543_06005 [Puia sp.]|nr:hypothetical protein [Puia sp.]